LFLGLVIETTGGGGVVVLEPLRVNEVSACGGGRVVVNGLCGAVDGAI